MRHARYLERAALLGWLCLIPCVACGARSALEVGGGAEGGGGTAPEDRCGDGVVQPGEACDDGNNTSGDGCEANCTLITCGNGKVDPGEACDEPNPLLCTPICTIPICGDGFVAPNEECDDGSANGDRIPALLMSVDGGPETRIIPVASFSDAVSLYAYGSASAHSGFEQPLQSELFLYAQRGVTGLSLVTIHNIDVDTSGIVTGDGVASQSFTGLPSGTFVALSDDNEELAMLSDTEAAGDWEWHDNTDGGILGGIPFPGEFRIDVTSDLGPIEALAFEDATGPISVDLNSTVTLIGHASGPSCTLTCTAVRCGDAIVDAGEACDDGNNVDKDGCAADCSRFD